MRKYVLGNKKVCLLETYDGSALFIASYILQILLQFVFSIILVTTKVDVSFTESLAGSCILTVINESAMLITPFVYSKIKGENLFKSSGFNKGINIMQILMVIGIALTTIMTFAPVANAFVSFIVWTGYDTTKITTLVMDSWTTYIVSVLIMAILPALCEEFLYRGMIARSFGDKGIIFGIFISATLFALMHGNPIQLVHQFFIGVVCATVFFITRSIWASVVVHFINNFVALTGNFILNQTGHLDFKMPVWGDIVSFIVGAICLVGLLILFYNYSKNKRGDKTYNAPLFKGMKYQMSYMFRTDEERDAIVQEQNIRSEQLESCDSEQMQEVMRSALKEQKGKIDKKSRNSLIYAFVLGGAVWILNTIMGYIG